MYKSRQGHLQKVGIIFQAGKLYRQDLRIIQIILLFILNTIEIEIKKKDSSLDSSLGRKLPVYSTEYLGMALNLR